MSTTLTIISIVSWLLLLLMVFLYERLDRRMASLSVLTQQLLRQQEYTMKHLGVVEPEDEQIRELKRLAAEGKVLEAQTIYRAWTGSSFKESRIFMDNILAGALPSELTPPQHPSSDGGSKAPTETS